ncbi:hypothetical protein M5K25_019915 [Dendrobium thyrsiflorum]|uniref:Uncharacterized protein n=1 Tax=Dendrobium thyrsiflorum TaxID=117978 RepID=A0ABD0UGQ1_DENTH
MLDPALLDGLTALWRHLEVRVLVGNPAELRRQTVVRRRYDVRQWSDRKSGVRWWFSRTLGVRWWFGRTSGLKQKRQALSRTSGLEQNNVRLQVVVWQNVGPQVVVRQNVGPQVVVRQNVRPSGGGPTELRRWSRRSKEARAISDLSIDSLRLGSLFMKNEGSIYRFSRVA